MSSDSLSRSAGGLLLLRGRRIRQAHPQDCASFRMIKGHHLSTVGFNNALNNGQSQTGSAAPLGEKRLKNLGQIDIANARPMVFNETGDPCLSVGPPYLCPDRDCGAGWRMPNCIIDDVLK